MLIGQSIDDNVLNSGSPPAIAATTVVDQSTARTTVSAATAAAANSRSSGRIRSLRRGLQLDQLMGMIVINAKASIVDLS